MRLQIENLAKIEKVDINIDGITVIAGANNTGKSTISKTLYCVFNSLYDVENKIYKDQLDYIETVFRNLPIKNEFGLRGVRNRKTLDYIHKFAKDLLESTEKTAKNAEATDVFINMINELDEEKVLDKETIQEFSGRLNDILNVPNEDIINTIINRSFKAEFTGQINHVNEPDSVANVNLTIKDKHIDLNITDNEVIKVDSELQITTPAIYFDDPLLLNELDNRNYLYIKFMRDNQQIHSSSLLEFLKNEQAADNVVKEALLKGKLSNVLSILNSVVGGEIVGGENGETFRENGLEKPLHFSNLASGLKTFVIIRDLLLNGSLVEKGVLILDEPEVHLHPEWQLKFAEIIVLLQKEFNLHTLLATHSPYFLRAIEVYSAKHRLADRCHYYMTKLEKGKAKIVDVTTCTDEIYQMLAGPFAELDRIRLEEEEK